MAEFTVNGQIVKSAEDGNLLSFLRDKMRITSVKDGCSSGACGTCTVIVDGRAVRACTQKLSRMESRHVLTIEGLSYREKEVFGYAFAECGAVQCGFCIPGMVMCGKALIDENADPSPQEVKKALRGNICRCTGYVKIEEALLLAAKMLREDTPVPNTEFTGKLGENFHRMDAYDKTLGTGIYVDDIVLPGMVYARALRTPYPRARVVSIEAQPALDMEGVIAVITAKDVPGNIKVGHLIKDWDALIAVGGETRYVGDAVAIVVAETPEAVEAGLEAVEVIYEVLSPLRNPQESLAEGAPQLHAGNPGNILKQEKLRRGDADAAISRAKHVVTRHYSVPFTEHAFMEPECAIAMPEDDGLLLYTASQSIYDEQREISEMLGLPPEAIHVEAQLVGGGFGGKEDMSVQHHAALAAYITKRPVKVKFSRQESICVHPKRHAMEMDFTTACDENGLLLGMKATIISDTGAYASLGGPVLQRACTHAAGPYNYQNISIDGTAVYTNNPPGGAFRGFGVTQSAFATEMNLNLLAEMVGISPWEIRYRNAIRPGQVLPNGQIADASTALIECLEAVRETYERAEFAGIASCFKNSGLGVGVPDTGRCIVSVEGGQVHIRTSAACIGQGMGTVVTQMVCECLGIAPDAVVYEAPDTKRTPNSGTTTASRQTVFTGEATLRAARLLKAEFDAGHTLEALEGREFYAEFKPHTDPMGAELENPVSHVAYGYAAQVAELDAEGRLTKVTAAYDVGRVVNPKACEGQIEGGVAMGLGYALTEDYPLRDSVPTAKYGTLGLFRAPDMPDMEIIIVDRPERTEDAYGTKGVGELATIPTAPAVAGAYYALDGKFRTKLPLEGTLYKK